MAMEVTFYEPGDKVYTLGDHGESYEWVVDTDGRLQRA